MYKIVRKDGRPSGVSVLFKKELEALISIGALDNTYEYDVQKMSDVEWEDIKNATINFRKTVHEKSKK